MIVVSVAIVSVDEWVILVLDILVVEELGLSLLPAMTAVIAAATPVLLELPLLSPSYYNVLGPKIPGT